MFKNEKKYFFWVALKQAIDIMLPNIKSKAITLSVSGRLVQCYLTDDEHHLIYTDRGDHYLLVCRAIVDQFGTVHGLDSVVSNNLLDVANSMGILIPNGVTTS